MPDLSSAFDVIDHDIVLTRFRHSFSANTEALGWMRLYISGRVQCVSVSNGTSADTHLCCGVPQ